MTVKLGARIEADVAPLVDALNTAGDALDRFEGRMLAANDDLARLGDAGSASLEGLASGAGLAADALAPLGAAAEAVQAVAVAANDSDAAFAAATESSGTAAAALAELLSAVNDNVAGLGSVGNAAAESFDRLGSGGAEALSSLVEPAKESASAVSDLGRAAEETAASVSEVDRAAGNTSGLDNFARATNAVGAALAELTAGDEELAREAAANQQQLQVLADARTAMGETLRQADRDNADTSREILDQASRIAEDGFAVRVALEQQFWNDNQHIEEAGGKTALELMTSALAEQSAVMAEELAKCNQTAREQMAELRTTLDDAYKEYLAPAVGRSDDIAGNNRSIIPTGGAMLNQALEQAGYGPADQTWQETVVRSITDGLETIGATAERSFSTLKESGSSALHEIGSESGVAEQAASGFQAALDGIGSAASSAVDRLARLVTDGLRATERGFAETGAAAQTAGQDVVSATAAVGSGGAAMGREVAEGAETGSAALAEMERMGEGVALGMAARAGAISTALRALGPVGLGAAAVIGGLFLAFDGARKAEDELSGINQALARTGAAATLTARDVQALAESLSRHSMSSRAELLQAEQELMQYHSVLGANFEKTLQLSADLSAALGGTLSANVKLLGAALDEPEQALENLERAGVRFTESQRDLIESLAESGRKFEAQQAILDAVADSVGGADAGAQSGLTGRVKGLTEAWRSFVEYFTGSDSLIGQTVSNVTAAITGLSGALGVVVDSITSALDHSIESQIAKLQKEKEALEVPLKSGDFGFQGFFDKYLGNSDAARRQAEDQVKAINQSIAELNARQHQQDLVEAIAAEDKQGKVRTEMARIVAGEIVEIDDALNDRLNELSSTRIDKIREEADAQIRVIEGQKAQAQSLGLDTSQYDAAILKVRQWETAEAARAEATERSTRATREAIDPNLKLIDSLQAELDLVGLSNRERSIEQAVRRLSADATDEQKDKVRELATALYDEKAAVDASTKAQQVLGNLRQQLANLNASSGDLAAAQAIKQLGDNASVADKAMASLLARQIQDGREARQVIDSVRDGTERYEQELGKLNHLLEAGAIDQQTFERASEQAYERMLQSSDHWADGIERGWRRWSEAAYDGAALQRQARGQCLRTARRRQPAASDRRAGDLCRQCRRPWRQRSGCHGGIGAAGGGRDPRPTGARHCRPSRRLGLRLGGRSTPSARREILISVSRQFPLPGRAYGSIP